MILNSCTCNTSNIGAKVKTMRVVRFLHYFHASGRRGHDFSVFILRQTRKIGGVAIGHDHEMSAVVRELVEYRITVLPSPNNQICLVFVLLRNTTKKAFF